METKTRLRAPEWGKNLAIVLLTLLAAVLIRQSTLYEGFVTAGRQAQPSAGIQWTAGESRMSARPTRLAAQNAQGRFGVQYNRSSTDALFEEKLGSLLREALSGASGIAPANRLQWQAVIQGDGAWIYYDFSDNLPLTSLPIWLGSAEANPALAGAARAFLLTERNGIYALYCYDDVLNRYYFCNLAEGSGERFAASIAELAPNGMQFSFELPSDDVRRTAGDYLMILPGVLPMSVYEVKNPISQPTSETQEEILRALSFNPTAVSYESAEAIVAREGSDTLRVMKDGSLVFHAQGNDRRYPISQENISVMIEQLYQLLSVTMADRGGDARAHYAGMETQEDGSLQVRFGYHLDGAVVKLPGKGYAAEFVVENGSVRDFTIHLRTYQKTEQQVVVLPLLQAAAAALAQHGEHGGELQLAYWDTGEDFHMQPEWIVR